MERFLFRPLTLADIAKTIDKNPVDLRLTTNDDGSIEIETPTLTAARRAQLRTLFTSRGFVEDTR